MKINLEKILDEERKIIKKSERMKQMKNQSQRFHAFQEQIEDKGIDEWKINMFEQKELQKKDLDFQYIEAL